MGSLNKSDSNSQTRSESSTNVWQAQSPFLQDLYQQAQQQFNNFAPNQQLQQQGQQGIQNLLQGNQNPALQAYGQQFQDQLGQLNQQSGGQAGLAGAYGGGRQGVLESQNQQNIAGQMARFYGDQYQQDQNRVLNTIQSLPGQLQLDPYQQQQGALQNYGQALGGPSILAQSTSAGDASSDSKGGSFMGG